MAERFMVEFCTETPKLMLQIDNDLKGQNLLTIRKLLNEVRSDMAQSSDVIKNEALRTEMVERYFNVYDTACALYYSKAVDPQTFRTLFTYEISNLVKQELSDSKLVQYPFIKRFLEEVDELKYPCIKKFIEEFDE